MRKIILLVLFVFRYILFFASPVDSNTAKIVGENFLAECFNLNKSVSWHLPDLELLTQHTKNSGQELFYIFNTKNSNGFIIISADDRIFPVLGYSIESSYNENMEKPEAFIEWIDNTIKQIEVTFEKNLSPDLKTIEAWKHYLTKNLKGGNKVNEVIPLIKTAWDQGKYYNKHCPKNADGVDGHVPVGCVAVAMAQVMKYWNYPAYGSGEFSYICHPYGTLAATYASTRYDWQSMPNILTAYNDEVSTLLYHCGVSVKMNYDAGGSGAYMFDAVNSFLSYFDYSNKVKLIYKADYTDNAWDSIIRRELELGQPVVYAGGTHAFNVDGFQANNYFHVNWGWNGFLNGYFYLSSLAPQGYNFSSYQQAIINIRPNCGLSNDNLSIFNMMNGTITDNGGKDYNYMNCTDKHILIAPPDAKVLRLEISEFQTIEGQDSLFVYDGDSELSPLIVGLSGKVEPFKVFSSTGKMFLRFNSNFATTDRGFVLKYSADFTNETYITDLISPVTKPCGKSNDSVVVVVKNFGIDTANNIEVQVITDSKEGQNSFSTTITNEILPGQVDTLFLGYLNTLPNDTYKFQCSTVDYKNYEINIDLVRKSMETKEIINSPFIENIDRLNYQMQDWFDKNQKTFITFDKINRDKYFRAILGKKGNEVDKNHDQFLIFNRKIGNITSNAQLYFNYRILSWDTISHPAVLNEFQKVKVLVSWDCGNHFDTVFTINSMNHKSDSMFQKINIPLKKYTNYPIIIGFSTAWDSACTSLDYDNIIVVDSLKMTGNNDILFSEYGLTVYPNPSKGIFFIKNIKTSQGTVNLLIMDVSGKLLINRKIEPESGEFRLDISDLPAGNYFIGIKAKEKTVFSKIMKE